MTLYAPNIAESQIMGALGDFLTLILPGVDVIAGQSNQVPEPAQDSFVVMTPLARSRVSLNVDSRADVLMTGSIAGTTMTITAAAYGLITVGAPVFGIGVADNTYVTAIISGSGGVGTYTITPSQTITSEKLSFGTNQALAPTRVTIQLDFHDSDGSADNVQTVFTLFRDQYGCAFFEGYPISIIPLYADEPRQAPFINGENQYEDRWTLDVVLQVNPVVSTPQQFADTVTVVLKEIDATFPPGA